MAVRLPGQWSNGPNAVVDQSNSSIRRASSLSGLTDRSRVEDIEEISPNRAG